MLQPTPIRYRNRYVVIYTESHDINCLSDLVCFRDTLALVVFHAFATKIAAAFTLSPQAYKQLGCLRKVPR